MKKTAVVIGASRDAIHTIKTAKKMGVRVIALDGNPKAEGLLCADEIRIVDISDMEKTCEEVRKIAPDFILPVPIGRYLLTTGYVNEKCGLKGIQYSETNASTDKYLFHKRLQEKGLREIKLHLVNREKTLDDLKIKYPAIMKPRYGSGSRDVFYVDSDEALKDAYELVIGAGEDFVLEQAVSGHEYGVDGAVMDGKLNIVLIRKKINTPLPVRQAVASLSVADNPENQELMKCVQEHLQGVVEALGYQNCLINADVIVEDNCNDIKIFTIEISPRPSGHNLHNLFVPLATEIDMAEEYIKYLLDEEYCFLPKRVESLLIKFFDFEDVKLKKIPTEEELIRTGKCNLLRWLCNMKVGETLEKVTNGHSIMGRGLFVVKGTDEQDLLRQMEWVLSQFEFEED